MAVLLAAVLDTAAGFRGPVPPRLVSEPGLSRSPGHLRSHSLTGTDSKQSSPWGSILLQNKEAVQQPNKGKMLVNVKYVHVESV